MERPNDICAKKVVYEHDSFRSGRTGIPNGRTCLQLPIQVGCRFNLTDNVPLFIQAGPTLAYGIAGTKIEWYSGGETNYFDVAKRFDLGLGGRVGVEFSKFQISVGTNYGVLDAFDGAGAHNLSINLGLGYMF